ncbi:unnamed protein product [Protopolystoma xenopodis]|uniref:Uncharacterized protein n=1 Tax=Protopolystoma xenopodis TaxID=117903 RepID=A0A3S5CU92_9PLAT|nr:unnamed protein product [Protopolystoma xenopodis]
MTSLDAYLSSPTSRTVCSHSSDIKVNLPLILSFFQTTFRPAHPTSDRPTVVASQADTGTLGACPSPPPPECGTGSADNKFSQFHRNHLSFECVCLCKHTQDCVWWTGCCPFSFSLSLSLARAPRFSHSCASSRAGLGGCRGAAPSSQPPSAPHLKPTPRLLKTPNPQPLQLETVSDIGLVYWHPFSRC